MQSLLTGPFEAVRIQAITAVEISYGDRVLVNLGKFQNGTLSCTCELPVCKQESGEDAQTAIERLLRGKLAPFAERLDVHGSTFLVDERESHAFGLPSKYLKTTFVATSPVKCSRSTPQYECARRESGSRVSSRPATQGNRSSMNKPSVKKGASYYANAVWGSRTTDELRGWVFRTNTRKRKTVVKPKDVELESQRPVMAVTSTEDEGTTYLYAWLASDAFAYFSQGLGREELKDWIDSLEIPSESDITKLRDPDSWASPEEGEERGSDTSGFPYMAHVQSEMMQLITSAGSEAVARDCSTELVRSSSKAVPTDCGTPDQQGDADGKVP